MLDVVGVGSVGVDVGWWQLIAVGAETLSWTNNGTGIWHPGLSQFTNIEQFKFFEIKGIIIDFRLQTLVQTLSIGQLQCYVNWSSIFSTWSIECESFKYIFLHRIECVCGSKVFSKWWVHLNLMYTDGKYYSLAALNKNRTNNYTSQYSCCIPAGKY